MLSVPVEQISGLVKLHDFSYLGLKEAIEVVDLRPRPADSRGTVETDCSTILRVASGVGSDTNSLDHVMDWAMKVETHKNPRANLTKIDMVATNRLDPADTEHNLSANIVGHHYNSNVVIHQDGNWYFLDHPNAKSPMDWKYSLNGEFFKFGRDKSPPVSTQNVPRRILDEVKQLQTVAQSAQNLNDRENLEGFKETMIDSDSGDLHIWISNQLLWLTEYADIEIPNKKLLQQRAVQTASKLSNIVCAFKKCLLEPLVQHESYNMKDLLAIVDQFLESLHRVETADISEIVQCIHQIPRIQFNRFFSWVVASNSKFFASHLKDLVDNPTPEQSELLELIIYRDPIPADCAKSLINTAMNYYAKQIVDQSNIYCW